MELVWGVFITIVGSILLIFNEKIIELLNSDKHYSHKQNRHRHIIVGIGLIIVGFGTLLEYFGFI